MQDSGYLSLRSTAAQFAAWHENQPTNLISSDSVYRAVDGTILGHVSATQIYRRTWLWHQLACIAGHAESGESRLSLYAMAASVPSVYHGTTACALAYFNQAHRWHQVFFQQFVAWLNDPSLATICSFDRFERELPPEDFEAPGCEVRHARSDHELVQAATLVRAHLPEVTADALDIHPGELQRAPEQLRDRGREVLMLYEHGELVGVALCDLGDPDLSLFNLFNMGQLYVRTGRLTPSSQAQRMLAAKVRHIYATHGIERSMLVAPADTLEHSVEPDTRWVERMGCLVIADRGLRQFENFCRFHFGRRWRRHASSNTTGERS
jgi:hypothetical protein